MNEPDLSLIIQALYILFFAGIPVILFFLIKDYVRNVAAFIQIKMGSNFQFINSFEYGGRKKCRIFSMTLQKTVIQDVEKEQLLFVPNCEFAKMKVWLNTEVKNSKTKT